MHTSSKILAGAALATAFLAFSPTQAQAVEMTLLGDYCGGSADATVFCSQLGDRYDVSGGLIVDPAVDLDGRHLTPGSNTGDARQVDSYNVTSSLNEPVGIGDDIRVSNLKGSFDFYWGSVDSFNLVEFFLDGDSDAVKSFSGTDVALADGRASGTGPYDFDQYVSFTGEFDTAVFSSSGASFEVATKVPEPAAIALLGLGLLSLGLIRIRTRHV